MFDTVCMLPARFPVGMQIDACLLTPLQLYLETNIVPAVLSVAALMIAVRLVMFAVHIVQNGITERAEYAAADARDARRFRQSND